MSVEERTCNKDIVSRSVSLGVPSHRPHSPLCSTTPTPDNPAASPTPRAPSSSSLRAPSPLISRYPSAESLKSFAESLVNQGPTSGAFPSSSSTLTPAKSTSALAEGIYSNITNNNTLVPAKSTPALNDENVGKNSTCSGVSGDAISSNAPHQYSARHKSMKAVRHASRYSICLFLLLL